MPRGRQTSAVKEENRKAESLARIDEDQFETRTEYAHPDAGDVADNKDRFEQWRCKSPNAMYVIFTDRVVFVGGESHKKNLLYVRFRDHNLVLDRNDPDFEAITTKLRRDPGFKRGTRLWCLSDLPEEQASVMEHTEGRHLGKNSNIPIEELLGSNNPALKARLKKLLQLEADEGKRKTDKENKDLRLKVEALQKKNEELEEGSKGD